MVLNLRPGSSSEILFALKSINAESRSPIKRSALCFQESDAESRSPISRTALCDQEISGACAGSPREDYLRQAPSVCRLEHMRENACALKVNVHKRGSHVM